MLAICKAFNIVNKQFKNSEINVNIWMLVLHITNSFLPSAAESSHEGPLRDCEYFFTDVSEAVRSTKLLVNALFFPRKFLRLKGE